MLDIVSTNTHNTKQLHLQMREFIKERRRPVRNENTYNTGTRATTREHKLRMFRYDKQLQNALWYQY